MVSICADIIIIRDGKILLEQRRGSPKGLCLPGGHHEEGESLEQTAIREVKEETNLDIISLKQFHVYSNPKRDPRGQKISVVFIADATGELKAGSDASSTMWLSFEEIDMKEKEFAFDHYQIIQDYKKTLD